MRNLQTKTVSRFRGLNSWLSLNLVSPDQATDLMNVIPSSNGELDKMRVPVTVSDIRPAATGPIRLFPYLTATSMVAQFGIDLYKYSIANGAGMTGTLITGTVLTVADPISMVELNTYAYIANGTDMVAYINGSLQPWGFPLALAPVPLNAASAVAAGQGNARTILTISSDADGIVTMTLADGLFVAALDPVIVSGVNTTAGVGTFNGKFPVYDMSADFRTVKLSGGPVSCTGSASTGTAFAETFYASFAVTAAVRTGGVTELTLAAALAPTTHPFIAGDWITVNNIEDQSFNGEYQVLAGTPGLKYAQAGLPDATPVVSSNAYVATPMSFSTSYSYRQSQYDPASGHYGPAGPVYTIQAPVSSSSSTGGVSTATLAHPGHDYAAGDTVKVSAGNNDCVITIDAVSAAGGVIRFHVTTPGSGYTLGTFNTVRVTGTGSAFVVNVTATGNSALPDSRMIRVGLPTNGAQTWQGVSIFRTTDGGGDYYQLGDPAGGSATTPVVISDTSSDSGNENLDLEVSAPLINFAPPAAKYTAKWQGRAYLFNLDSDPMGIAYSGYEQILLGLPERSFPPNNRLHLQLGADPIRGGGVVQSGVIAFSQSDRMYMQRGVIEDVTVNTPVQFTSYLEELPWHIGCSSHESIVSTPYGLVWLAGDLSIRLFDGTNRPLDVSGQVYPLLRSITPGQAQNACATYFTWLDRDWYVITFAVDGSTQNNRLVFLDLSPDVERNIGIFVSSIQADTVNVAEDPNGTRYLVIAQQGNIRRLIVNSDATGGITLTPSATNEILPAWWQGGPVGNETPQEVKMYRYSRLTTDPPAQNADFRMGFTLTDNEERTFESPQIIPLARENAWNSYGIDVKATGCAPLVQFPDKDLSCHVLQVITYYVPTAIR